VLFGTVIEGTYFFRVVQAIFFKKRDSQPARDEAPALALVPMFLVVALIIAIGVYPDAITGLLDSAAAELLERAQFIRSVLG